MIKKNQPAYPMPNLRQTGEQQRERDFNFAESGQKGMTIRQVYAKAAMQGELASQIEGWNYSENSFNILARRCFEIADALIKWENENG